MLDLSKWACLGETLLDLMSKYKDCMALFEVNRDREIGSWTYSQFFEEASRLAALVQDHGFASGDRCAILMSNQSKWLFSATGVFWAGGILVPLDYKLTPSEQLSLLKHSKASVLITEWPIWLYLRKENWDLDQVLVLVTEAPANAQLGRTIRWETSLKKPFQFFKRVREDVACIVYSSGTGGRPKGCMLTHGNYLYQAQVLGEMFPIQSKDRYFSILPTNHAIDFMCGFILPLHFGAAIVHQRTLRPEFLVSTMRRYGISHMALVPMLLKAFEKRTRENLESLPKLKQKLIQQLIALNAKLTKKTPKYQFSKILLKPIHQAFGGNLRLLFAGGAFVDPSTAEFFYRIGLPVVIGYGLTEAGTTLTVNDLRPFRADTVGKPLPGCKIELRDQNKSGVGEVWVNGPTMMKGYLDDPDLTKEVLVDGWLKTGDLGIFDPTGHLKLVGRAKNMIVTEGGKNIYPEDVESTFEDLQGSQEVCVFAANYIWPTGRLTDEQLLIVVRPNPGLAKEKLKSAILERNQKLADFKRLAAFMVWEREFPRTASLKIKRDLLAQEIAKSFQKETVLQTLS